MKSLKIGLLLAWSAWLHAQEFKEVALLSGLEHWSADVNQLNAGVALFDFDNDGYLDVVATGGWDTLRIFQNDREGGFDDVTLNIGLAKLTGVVTAGVTTGDFDKDGWTDLLVTTDQGFDNYLFRNINGEYFEDVSASSGIQNGSKFWSTSAIFVDVNLDGFLDIYVANYVGYDEAPFEFLFPSNARHPNSLFVNNQNGTFVERASSLGINTARPTLVVTAFDLNGDFIPDLFEGNDFESDGINELFLNTLLDSGKFTPVAKKVNLDDRGNFMGVNIGDVNHDLKMDIFLSDFRKTLLKLDIGDELETCSIPIFNELSTSDYSDVNNTPITWGTSFADYNNDAQLDLIVSCGELYAETPRPLWIFENDNGFFYRRDDEFGLEEAGKGRGLAVGDYDNDGDLDIFWAHTSGNPVLRNRLMLFRNDHVNSNNWIKIKLSGVESNPHGYNSTLYFHLNDTVYMRHVDGGSSYMSQHDVTVHFGMGEQDAIDSLQIIWPGGKSQWHFDLLSNQTHLLEEEMTHFTMLNSPANFDCFQETIPDQNCSDNANCEDDVVLSISEEQGDFVITNRNGQIHITSNMTIERVHIWDLQGVIKQNIISEQGTEIVFNESLLDYGINVLGLTTKQGLFVKKLVKQ